MSKGVGSNRPTVFFKVPQPPVEPLYFSTEIGMTWALPEPKHDCPFCQCKREVPSE